MESMSPECTPLKTAYDTCFQNWYTTKFLKHAEERADTSRRQDKNASSNASASANTASASSTDNNTHTDMGMDECDELFKAYKGCVMVRCLCTL